MRTPTRQSALNQRLEELARRQDSDETPIRCQLLLGDGSTIRGEVVAVHSAGITLEAAGVTHDVPADEIYRLQVAVPNRLREWLFVGSAATAAGLLTAAVFAIPGLYVEAGLQKVIIPAVSGSFVLVYGRLRTRLRAWQEEWREWV